MIDVFKEDTIRSIVKETEGNEIILSAKERREVLKNLKSQKKIIWGDRLFQYSKRIPNDSLIYYSTNSYEEINKTMKFDSTGKLLCLPKYEKYIEKRVFVFTNPILLRNNSIQMIYVLYKCGNNCGHDEIVFYKRLNNEWEKWIICYSGEF
jgi:predicted Zn-dependent protease